MKNVMTWLKSNIVVVASVVVMIASLVGLYMVASRKRAFNDLLSQRIAKVNEIDGLRNTAVTIDPASEEGQPVRLSMTINEPTIEKRKLANEKIEASAARVIDLIHDINRRGHVPMTKGLFPKPADSGALHLSKVEYRRLLREMLQPFEPGASGPRLDAGEPPAKEVIDRTLEEAEKGFLAGMGIDVTKKVSDKDLSSKEFEQLLQRKRERLVRLLRNRAESIHVYAKSNIDLKGFPFEVGAWSAAAAIPDIKTVWEGQMELWIQQDLARAIAMTNRVRDPASNVITAPVKEILGAKVIDGILRGWVGFNSEGGLSSKYKLKQQQNPFGMFPGMMPGMMPGMGYPGMYPGMGYPGMEGMPGMPGTQAKKKKKKKVKKGEVKPDFKLSTTGRNSNDYYDVHHAELKVLVDSARLPELIENIQRVNLMTVLDVTLSDIDEYSKLREGYFYGDDDVVEATLIIETVWLRDWLDKLMPKEVKEKRKIAQTTGR